MGPFELMDLVGVDTGFEVSKSFFEQSFGEPRWRPSPFTARYVAAGRYGRKTGRGYYVYEGDREDAGAGGAPRHRPDDPEPLQAEPPGHGEGVVVIAGTGPLSDQLRSLAAQAGYEVRSPYDPTGGVLPALIVECDREPPGRNRASSAHRPERRAPAPPQGGARLLLCGAGSLGALDPAGSAVGFHVIGPLEHAGLSTGL